MLDYKLEGKLEIKPIFDGYSDVACWVDDDLQLFLLDFAILDALTPWPLLDIA